MQRAFRIEALYNGVDEVPYVIAKCGAAMGYPSIVDHPGDEPFLVPPETETVRSPGGKDYITFGVSPAEEIQNVVDFSPPSWESSAQGVSSYAAVKLDKSPVHVPVKRVEVTTVLGIDTGCRYEGYYSDYTCNYRIRFANEDEHEQAAAVQAAAGKQGPGAPAPVESCPPPGMSCAATGPRARASSPSALSLPLSSTATGATTGAPPGETRVPIFFPASDEMTLVSTATNLPVTQQERRFAAVKRAHEALWRATQAAMDLLRNQPVGECPEIYPVGLFDGPDHHYEELDGGRPDPWYTTRMRTALAEQQVAAAGADGGTSPAAPAVKEYLQSQEHCLWIL